MHFDSLLYRIMDYDYILVLDDGNVVEYDTPVNMVKNNEVLSFYIVFHTIHPPCTPTTYLIFIGLFVWSNE